MRLGVEAHNHPLGKQLRFIKGLVVLRGYCTVTQHPIQSSIIVKVSESRGQCDGKTRLQYL